MKNIKGFSLLELLVVILVIGVLAAVALPQYKKAVVKAELTQLIARVNPLAEAQERYYMARGSYANSAKDLDMDVKNPQGFDCSVTDFWVYCANLKLIYVVFFKNISSTNVRGRVWCGTRNIVTTDRYDNICRDLFPQAKDITTQMSAWLGVRKGWRVR